MCCFNCPCLLFYCWRCNDYSTSWIVHWIPAKVIPWCAFKRRIYWNLDEESQPSSRWKREKSLDARTPLVLRYVSDCNNIALRNYIPGGIESLVVAECFSNRCSWMVCWGYLQGVFENPKIRLIYSARPINPEWTKGFPLPNQGGFFAFVRVRNPWIDLWLVAL